MRRPDMLTAEQVKALADALPDDFLRKAAELEADVRALAAIAIDVADRYRKVTIALELMLPTDQVKQGGDLMCAVGEHTGWHDLDEVLHAIGQAVHDAADGRDVDEDITAAVNAAAGHREEYEAAPIVLFQAESAAAVAKVVAEGHRYNHVSPWWVR